MTAELEKIDLVRMRMSVSYQEAYEALNAAGGDVVGAIIELEDSQKDLNARLQDRGSALVDSLCSLVHKGYDTKLRFKQGDRTVMEVPGTVAAVGLLAATASNEVALLLVAGTLVAMANKYTLELDWPDQGARPITTACCTDAGGIC